MYKMPRLKIPKPLEFNWDLHNIEKNWNKHKVKYKECEQAFINKPHLIFEDVKHSQSEIRYNLFGITNNQRLITVTYTLRSQQVRVISARDLNKKERKKYAEETS
jgi:uncharacterized protein